jgi:hypothetical protein
MQQRPPHVFIYAFHFIDDHVTIPAVFCNRCDYNLANLPSGLCPECGEVFDTANPRSFARISGATLAGRGVWLWRLLVAANVVCVLPNVFATLAACVARSELGWWPRPMIDDPKGLILAGPFDELFMASIVPALFAIIVAFVLSLTAIATGQRRKFKGWIIAGVCGLAGPVLFFVGFASSTHAEWMLD